MVARETLVDSDVRLALVKFSQNLATPATRKLYEDSVAMFLNWRAAVSDRSLRETTPEDVSDWLRSLTPTSARSTISLRRTALRKMFATLQAEGIIQENPAEAAGLPGQDRPEADQSRQSARAKPSEGQQLLNSIEKSDTAGLRDRAVIAMLVYTPARVFQLLAMNVSDVIVAHNGLSVRLSNRLPPLPCPRYLEECLLDYIDETGLCRELNGPLFRPIGRITGRLGGGRLSEVEVDLMIRRRARAAGVEARKIGSYVIRRSGGSDDPQSKRKAIAGPSTEHEQTEAPRQDDEEVEEISI